MFGKVSPPCAILCCLLSGVPCVRAADIRTGRTFTASDTSIYYEPLGSADGVPLVVANGGPGFDHTYLHVSAIWDALAQHRKVVLYDQRGVGKSSALAPKQSCTVQDQVEDLETLRVQLGAERIDLLGHSWGGFLAMAYAARYQQHIQHLLIVDSAAPKFSDTAYLFKEIFPEVSEHMDSLLSARQKGDSAAEESWLRDYFSMLFYSTERRDAAIAMMTGIKQNKGVNGSIGRDLQKKDLSSELSNFHFPTLVITGRYDINVGPTTAYKIHKAIPGSQLVVFERSGHMPFFEEPEKFLQAVESFLK